MKEFEAENIRKKFQEQIANKTAGFSGSVPYMKDTIAIHSKAYNSQKEKKSYQRFVDDLNSRHSKTNALIIDHASAGNQTAQNMAAKLKKKIPQKPKPIKLPRPQYAKYYKLNTDSTENVKTESSEKGPKPNPLRTDPRIKGPIAQSLERIRVFSKEFAFDPTPPTPIQISRVNQQKAKMKLEEIERALRKQSDSPIHSPPSPIKSPPEHELITKRESISDKICTYLPNDKSSKRRTSADKHRERPPSGVTESAIINVPSSTSSGNRTSFSLGRFQTIAPSNNKFPTRKSSCLISSKNHSHENRSILRDPSLNISRKRLSKPSRTRSKSRSNIPEATKLSSTSLTIRKQTTGLRAVLCEDSPPSSPRFSDFPQINSILSNQELHNLNDLNSKRPVPYKLPSFASDAAVLRAKYRQLLVRA